MILRSLLIIFLCYGLTSNAQTGDRKAYIRDNYTKMERYITMRDGVRLFTSIYLPKDQTRKYPILITRTPYSVSPYGEDEYPCRACPFDAVCKGGIYICLSGRRGRWMSEGKFVDIRPYIPDKKNKE